MVSVSSVRNKLAAKVFNKIGSDVTIEALSSNSKDKWGDNTPTYSAGVTVTAVNYNYVKDSLQWQAFSDFQQGDVAIVVPHDTTVTSEDRITFDGSTWYVREIENFNMGDGTTNSILAIGLLLARSL